MIVKVATRSTTAILETFSFTWNCIALIFLIKKGILDYYSSFVFGGIVA